MKNKNKKILICGMSLSVFLLIFGVTYAFFNFSRETNSITLKPGTIYMRLTSDNGDITLDPMFPESREIAIARDDNYIDFTVRGLNTYNKPIYYEINTLYGDVPDGYTSDKRIDDNHVFVELTDLDTNNVLVTSKFNSLDNHAIYIRTIDTTTTEIEHNYRLRVWIDEDTLISDTDPNRSYCASTYCNDLTKKIYNQLFLSLKASVYADFTEKSTPGECFSYVADSDNLGEYMIMEYDNTCGGSVIIPRAINGNTITKVGPGAFAGNDTIISVTFLDNVKSIGAGAFTDCSNLTKATFSDGLEEIGTSAFMNDKLVSIKIPSTVTKIGSGAFYNNEDVEDIYVKWDTIGSDILVTSFAGLDKENINLHVPTGKNTIYSESYIFKDFNITN